MSKPVKFIRLVVTILACALSASVSSLPNPWWIRSINILCAVATFAWMVQQIIDLRDDDPPFTWTKGGGI